MNINQGLMLLLLSIGITISGCERNPPQDSKPTPVLIATAQTAWSPDGETIAFTWSGGSDIRRRGLYFINTSDWSIVDFLVDESGQVLSSPSWSATGEWLVFAASAHIYKIKKNGDSLTQLTFTGRQWSCDWSDSDTLIVYSVTIGDSAGTWLMQPDGSGKKALIRFGFASCFTLGDSILFEESIPPDYKWARMSLLNPVDSSIREVYRWEIGKPYRTYYNPKVAPDGQKIAVSIDGNIWTLSIEGRDLKPLTTDGGSYPNWSPDGSKIVYCKPDFAGGSIWIMNADGTDKTQIEGW